MGVNKLGGLTYQLKPLNFGGVSIARGGVILLEFIGAYWNLLRKSHQ